MLPGDTQTPEKPDIDWSDAEARGAEHLKEIVEDARRAALSLATDLTALTTTTPAAAEAATLLKKIVSDDVEEGPPSVLRTEATRPSTR